MMIFFILISSPVDLPKLEISADNLDSLKAIKATVNEYVALAHWN